MAIPQLKLPWKAPAWQEISRGVLSTADNAGLPHRHPSVFIHLRLLCRRYQPIFFKIPHFKWPTLCLLRHTKIFAFKFCIFRILLNHYHCLHILSTNYFGEILKILWRNLTKLLALYIIFINTNCDNPYNSPPEQSRRAAPIKRKSVTTPCTKFDFSRILLLQSTAMLFLQKEGTPQGSPAQCLPYSKCQHAQGRNKFLWF